jgi:hypothetical protein
MAKRVEVDIKTRGAAKASKDLGKVDKGLGRLAKSAAGVAAGFFGARMLLDGFRNVIDATKQQVLAEAQLNAVLKSTAGAAGLTAKELTGMASALQKQTRFGDEAIIKAQSLMLTFTKVGKEVFPDAIESVLNMSEAMGQDLQQGVIQVGKALNDPILGVTALRRVGVQLSDQQVDLVKKFTETGNIAEAQKIILSELETQFGGVARAAGETLGGSLDQMSNAAGDAAESIGEALSPAIIRVAGFFTDASIAVSGFFKRLTETNLETTIRELGELGAETRNLEQIRAKRIEFDLRKELVGTKSVKELKEANVELEEQLNEQLAKKAAAAIEIDRLEADGVKRFNQKTGLGSLELDIELQKQELADAEYRRLLDIMEANAVILNNNAQLLIIREQIAAFDAESADSGGKGGKAEEEKAKASDVFVKNSKDASTSLLASAVQGKEMANAGKDFTKSVALAVIQLIAQLAIEKRITDQKKQQARLATVGKVFGFGFQTGGSFINRFAGGGSFNVNKRTTLPTNPPAIVGDNASGMERVDVTPLPSPTSNGNNITINISAPLVDETVVDTIIPAIRRAEKLNL